MAGDYLFPKRLFKNGEPLDTTEINEVLQPPAERMNGHLGPHNIRAPLSEDVLSDGRAFFRTTRRRVVVDPEMVSALAGSGDGRAPTPEAAQAYVLEQQTGWTAIDAAPEGDEVYATVTTGASSLVITAHATHCFAGNADGTSAKYRVTVPRFTDPELRNGRLGNASSDALVTVIIILPDGASAILSDLAVPDARLWSDDTGHSQAVELASRIVAAGPASNAEGRDSSSGAYQDLAAVGWVSAVGWSVKSSGRTLTFTRVSKGPVTGAAEMEISFNTGPIFSTTRQMTEVVEGALSGTQELLSDLPSATQADGTVAAPYEVVLYYPAQIQYALRVDGVVITESITGRFDKELRPFTPARVVSPKSDDKDTAVGPYLGRFFEKPDAVNIPMYSVRLTATVDVEPGDHLVEVVVRRVPTGRRNSFYPPPPEVGNPTSGTVYLPTRHRVAIFNRQLVVVDSPREPVDAALFGQAVVVDAFDDEDVVSVASLVDEKMQPVADAINSVKTYQVARGALNGDHLGSYSTVLRAASTSNVNRVRLATQPIAGPPAYIEAKYVWPYGGTGNTHYLSFVGPPQDALHSSGTGSNVDQWHLIVSTAFEPLEATIGSPVGCNISIEGNVFLSRLVHSASRDDQMHLAAGVFCIALLVDTGSTYEWGLWPGSISWANSNNYFARQANKTATQLQTIDYLSKFGENSDTNDTVIGGEAPGDYVDVPVTAHFDLSESLLVRSIRGVAIFGTAAWMGGRNDGPARLVVDKASVNIIITKA